MIRALWVSGGLALIALFAMMSSPSGQSDPFGTLLRTAAAAGLLFFLGWVVGVARRRRPPNPIASRVILMVIFAVAIQVSATWFLPDWSIALWYLALFVTGLLLNRWCEAPERYAVLVAAFSAVMTSLILTALSAASPAGTGEMGRSVVLVALWRNAARVAANPGDAAWTWLAWRVADRLRQPEANRPKSFRVPAKSYKPKRPGQTASP